MGTRGNRQVELKQFLADRQLNLCTKKGDKLSGKKVEIKSPDISIWKKTLDYVQR